MAVSSRLISSDMSAANHADVLFVKDKKDNDLKTYCDKYNIKYTLFKDWSVVKDMVEKVGGVYLSVLHN